MLSISPQALLAGVNVILQFFVLSTDNLAGLSGADSVIRACLTSLDASLGLLLLSAIYTFLFAHDRKSRLYLERFALLHSGPEDLKAGLRMKIRTSWSRPFSLTTRTAIVGVAPVSL